MLIQRITKQRELIGSSCMQLHKTSEGSADGVYELCPEFFHVHYAKATDIACGKIRIA